MEYKQLDEVIRTFNDDLLKTRKDLQKLKESIDFTLKQIKQNSVQISSVDKLLKQKEIVPLFKKSLSKTERFSVFRDINQNIPLKCDFCFHEISNIEKIQKQEKKAHSKCYLCKQTYYESDEHHQQYLCGEAKINCQICGLQTERKNIDKHVKICNFRNCFKCNKKIYLKAFAFHLKVCKKQNKRVFSSKKQDLKENVPNFKQKTPVLWQLK